MELESAMEVISSKVVRIYVLYTRGGVISARKPISFTYSRDERISLVGKVPA